MGEKNSMLVKSIIVIALVFMGIGCGGGSSSSSTDTKKESLSSLSISSEAVSSESELLSSSEASSSEAVDYSIPLVNKNVYGKWYYVHNADTLEIRSNTRLNYDFIDDNLIKILDNDKSGYLIRSGNAKIFVTGHLVDNREVSTLRDFTQVQIECALQNRHDKGHTINCDIDSDGNITIADVPEGNYDLDIDHMSYPVNPKNEEEDIGDLVIDTGKPILKSRFVENGFVYADRTNYSGIVQINNIGNADTEIIEYNITADNTILITQNTLRGLSSTFQINKNGQLEIPVTLNFSPIDDNQKSVMVKITLKDSRNNIWSDEYPLQVYREKFSLHVSTSSSNIRGYIIMPYTHKTIPVDIANGKIFLPIVKAGKPYHLLIANESTSGETSYAIGVNTDALLQETDNKFEFEPNETEKQAKTLQMNESVTSYIHKGDLDFWKIDTLKGHWQLDLKCKGTSNTAMSIPISIISNNKLFEAHGWGETRTSKQVLSAQISGVNDYNDNLNLDIDFYNGYEFNTLAWSGALHGNIKDLDTGWIDIPFSYQDSTYCSTVGKFSNTQILQEIPISWQDEYTMKQDTCKNNWNSQTQDCPQGRIEAEEFCENHFGRLPRLSELVKLNPDDAKHSLYWVAKAYHQDAYAFDIITKEVHSSPYGNNELAYVRCIQNESTLP
jgi:hypothetical protein